jgi:hydrogenase maturation protease
MTILVIGYGNTLRSDDGAGQIVAETIDNLRWANVRSLSVHQLTPELAADIAESDKVVFIDAYPCSKKEAQLTIESLNSEENQGIFAHHMNPQSLLNLTQTLYGKLPCAWWILIPGVNFDFGENISPLTEKNIDKAITWLKNLINPRF